MSLPTRNSAAMHRILPLQLCDCVTDFKGASEPQQPGHHAVCGRQAGTEGTTARHACRTETCANHRDLRSCPRLDRGLQAPCLPCQRQESGFRASPQTLPRGCCWPCCWPCPSPQPSSQPSSQLPAMLLGPACAGPQARAPARCAGQLAASTSRPSTSPATARRLPEPGCARPQRRRRANTAVGAPTAALPSAPTTHLPAEGGRDREQSLAAAEAQERQSQLLLEQAEAAAAAAAAPKVAKAAADKALQPHLSAAVAAAGADATKQLACLRAEADAVIESLACTLAGALGREAVSGAVVLSCCTRACPAPHLHPRCPARAAPPGSPLSIPSLLHTQATLGLRMAPWAAAGTACWPCSAAGPLPSPVHVAPAWLLT